MAKIVYMLCSLMSMFCAILLARGFYRTKERLLFWSGWCFVFLTLANMMLIVDLSVPNYNLTLIRLLPSFTGMALLLYGLIWEVR